MAIVLKLSDDLVEMAKPYAAAENRSVSEQIEYWSRLGKVIDDDPTLPLQFIRDTMFAAQEAGAGLLTPYKFGTSWRQGLLSLAGAAARTSVSRHLARWRFVMR